MDRRKALKNIGLTTGFVVASPSILSLLQSCKTEPAGWSPAYLTSDEEIFVNNFVAILLPKTESLPGAVELNITRFIDTFINEVQPEGEQVQLRRTMTEIINEMKGKAEDLSEKQPEDFKVVMDKYLLVKGEIDEERQGNPRTPYSEERTISGDFVYDKPTKSEVLNGLKWMSINAYRWNEQVGENILVYEPIPATYECGDLQELTGGKLYSL